MAPPALTLLRSYAQKSNPSTLPSSVLYSHTPTTLTIFDCYPKSIFHFLILPRPSSSVNVFELATLRTLLKKKDREKAREVIYGLRDEAQKLKKDIEEEMMDRYGFVWEVWTGFHAVQSMEHMHLHVISADLTAPAMKKKKHYNSFHPKLGFFLHLEDIVSLFDAESSYFDTMAELKPSKYEPILKEDLVCFQCHKPQKNIPALKMHLQTEWDNLRKREKARLDKQHDPDETEATKATVNERKRGREDGSEDEPGPISDTTASSANGKKRREIDADE